MKNITSLLFPKYTKWEILEVFVDRNVHYCIQVRANKNTGLKCFRTTCINDSLFTANLENINIEKINKLTMAV